MSKIGSSNKREFKMIRTKNKVETKLGVMDKDESAEKETRKVNGRTG